MNKTSSNDDLQTMIPNDFNIKQTHSILPFGNTIGRYDFTYRHLNKKYIR